MAVNVQIPRPAPSETDKAHAAALQLLTLEAEIRQQKSQQDVLFHLVNAMQDLLPYGQALAWRRPHRKGGWQLKVVSGLPVADRHTPLARDLTATLQREEAAGHLSALYAFELSAPAEDRVRVTPIAEFPLRHALWLPLAGRENTTEAGALFLRETPFTPRDQALMQRLGDTYAHAWRAFAPRRALLDSLPFTRRTLGITAAALVGIGLIPVRLSVMAPVEVVADKPFVLTAPINGVIKQMLISPNAPVQANQPLVQFEDIQPRNEMIMAQQQLAVAEAKDSRTSAAAFNDRDAAHEMAIAAAEHNLARVGYNYSLEVLQRTTVRTPVDGIAVYSDRRDWEGRAVQVGEEILQVADATRIRYRLDLSTGNAIELAEGNPVSIYLESAPLGGLSADLASVSYTPHTLPGGQTSYALIAQPNDGATPRIGSRGTARVYGNYAPLAFQLLRRPIAAVRQYIGV
ncbi:HlyD family efflux transporter periplasmic adaptor subunit [Pseudomonas matsuisoli]|uniref:HlyD family secretion protein n=1 Tax=Pseudomonas matsuisoli TaxID=1515666 RepID=A0A917V1P0_9PSED|nr:HlyD family secretion protein [Pseudomonas matsuisoli]GGK09101.1 hypothetical protein GCM10009304_39060 [Pseudomonas matsuisoli]